MFAESTSNHNPDGFVIGPDGFAESSADILHDFLVEHPDDPEWGDPATWPAWTDLGFWCLGPDHDQLPGEDPLPGEPPDEWALTGPEDLEELRRVERLDRYLIDPELAHWIAYGNCRD
jgi:hypothetical protein